MHARVITMLALAAIVSLAALPARGADSSAQSTPGATAAPASADKELPPPYKTAGKFSHNLQKYSGLNFLSNQLVSATATVVASVALRGRTSVKVRSYNLSDMLQGEFRSVDVKVGSGKIHGVPIGALQVRSTTPFKVSYLPWRKTKPGLTTPVMVALNGKVSERLVAKALRSKLVSENLAFLRINLPGLGEQHLQVIDPKVDVKGDLIQVTTRMITAGASEDTAINLVIRARPVLEKERFIILKDIQVESPDIENPQEFAVFAEELLNPLIDFGRMDRATHAFRMTELEVKDQRVRFNGRLLLAPKAAPPAASATRV